MTDPNAGTDLPYALYREIGRVAVASNRLEAVVRLLIGAMIGGDEVTQDVALRGDQLPALLTKLGHLIEARIQELTLRKQGAEWIQAAKRANELRRETIHSSWIKSTRAPDEAMALLHGRRQTIRGRLLTSEKVAARAKVISAVAVAGIELIGRFRGALGWGTASILPAECVELHRPLIDDIDLPAARELWARLWPLCHFLESQSYSAAVKTACRLVGDTTGPVRRPLLPLEEDATRELSALLERAKMTTPRQGPLQSRRPTTCMATAGRLNPFS